MTTEATQKTVADLTAAELKELIREVVVEVVFDYLIDPDEGLEFREEFVERLEQSMAEADSGETMSAEEVYRRLVLD